MTIIRIDDAADERLDVFARLTEHQLRSVLERERAVMIAESSLVVEVALRAGLEPLALLMDARHLEAMANILADVPADVPVYVAERPVLSQLVGYSVTRGVMAALRRPQPGELDAVLAGARRVAVLEGLVDATNVGALMRSAAALGVDACLIDPTCADPYSRRAARVSMGASYTLPWSRVKEGRWPDAAFARLREQGFHIVALALVEGATPLDEPSLTAHERLALVFGTEGTGLTPRTLAACDEAAVIPMARGIDSLNVAAASAVAFWQLRPRTASGSAHTV